MKLNAIPFIIFIQWLPSGINRIYVPVNIPDRLSINEIRLTPIGAFGLLRKERLGIAAHYHTGIDILRPGSNYTDEPVFPAAPGKVISKRDDGPYAQLIIEHPTGDQLFWTLYEHISGIHVQVGDFVEPQIPIARFMNKAELDQYGWQFDHLHFEVLRARPYPVKPGIRTSERFFDSWTLQCYTREELERRYFDPIQLFKKNMDKMTIYRPGF